MKYFLLILNIIFLNSHLHAQIGVPEINSYSSLNYKGGTQNWDIAQDKNGVMYFANNEGLLSYNGRYWKLHQLPNKTVVRSLKLDVDGRIYVGGEDELGFFFPDSNGRLKYHSLIKLLPLSERKFSDVWNVAIDQNDVYFRTNTRVFQYNHRGIKIYDKSSAKREWVIAEFVNHQVLIEDGSATLFSVKNDSWKALSAHKELKNIYITSMASYEGDTVLIGTLKNGLYLLTGSKLVKKKTETDSFFIKNRINKVLKLHDHTFLVATVAGGCVIIDRNGVLLQHFDTTDGLQNNNIRSVFQDKNENLWLGLDDGIDFIAYNNAIKYIRPHKLKQTGGYASRILDNKLFIGTSNGLYVSALNPALTDISKTKGSFKEISNSQGQVWNLDVINNKLLIGHEEGGFVLDGDILKPLIPILGTWTFSLISQNKHSTEIIAGTYQGLRLIKYSDEKFISTDEVKRINESLRFVIYDSKSNTVWASHPYRGIYRFKLTSDHKEIEKTWLFKENSGLPSSLNNYIAKIKDRVVVATERGIYEFDDAKQKFFPSKILSPVLGKINFQCLKEDSYGNIWFITNKKIGVVDFQRRQGNKPYSLVYFPELTSKVVTKFESIYPYNKENIFVASTTGIIHINYLKYLQNIKPLTVHLTQVKISGNKDSVIFGGYFLKDGQISKIQDPASKVVLPFKYNSLHFEYSSTLFEQHNNIEFSYQLSGFDKEWSSWNSKCEKDYTNLPQGTYTFKVKARNNLGNELLAAPYTFVINPPWYQTYWFYFLCMLMVCFCVYLLIEWQKRKYLKEQRYINMAHQLEMEHHEKAIVKLKNEKLETKVHFQNKELASTTLHLMQRSKLLAKIKEELLPIKKNGSDEGYHPEVKKVLHLINNSERSDADWDQFAMHFDYVNSNFLKKLKEKVPSLSANDLKLCAYLKMNLTSKEIAQLMSITTRAVEVNRYRLRKKINVSSETNLFDYLIEITSS